MTSLSFTHSLTLSLSLVLSLLPPPLTLSISLSLALLLSRSHAQSFSHPLTLSLTHSLTHSLSRLSPCPILSSFLFTLRQGGGNRGVLATWQAKKIGSNFRFSCLPLSISGTDSVSERVTNAPQKASAPSDSCNGHGRVWTGGEQSHPLSCREQGRSGRTSGHGE